MNHDKKPEKTNLQFMLSTEKEWKKNKKEKEAKAPSFDDVGWTNRVAMKSTRLSR